jgi:HAD superfamily hydrolase (TIGR01549 family)
MLAERIEDTLSDPNDETRPGVRNPMNAARPVRAVLFDLDGTLYRQTRMRALMALELATLALSRPLQAPASWRVLAEFRKAQEALRGRQSGRGASGQFEIAARRTGVPVAEVETIVNEWMMDRPLKHLLRCRAAGLLPLLDLLSRRGIKVGVFSDYPPDRKLKALGIEGRFSVVLCSTDPEIGMFKPHPRGFLVAAARWQVDPSEVLVVGDRPDADAAGAAAAGMPCVIIGPTRASDSSDFVSFPSLERLRDVLDNDNDHHSR